MPGLDVRVNTDLLTDPVRRNLSGDAHSALLALQAYALKHDEDGFVETAAITPGPRWDGLPWVNDATLTELENAGLLERDAGGVQVSWEWQSTSAERAQYRERKRRNKTEERKRNRENKQIADACRARGHLSPSSSLPVTGDSPETHRRVGKDRSGIGDRNHSTNIPHLPIRTPSMSGVPDCPAMVDEGAQRRTRQQLRNERMAEAVRLKGEGKSLREIGELLSCSKDTVRADLKRAEGAQ
jgi:hypothetical protein